jgi:hypothetical protein
MFFASWYLVGSFIHAWCGLTNGRVYEVFGRTAMFAVLRELWGTVVMPHIAFFALLLAAFEMTTGILMLSKGRCVHYALIASVLFNLFLVQLGLGFPAVPWSGRDFLLNRLSCSLFAAMQVPLFWVGFSLTFLEFLRAGCPRSRF